MKTLTQILQEQKSGEYTRPAFSKVLGQVQSDEKKALEDLFPGTERPDIYKFNPRIDKNKQTASRVVNLFIAATGNVLNKYPNQPVLVKQVKDKWYFMYLPVEMQRVTDKFHTNTIIPDLKNAKNNKYYKLSGLSDASFDLASADKEKKQTDVEKNKNRLDWNQFIPLTNDYELGDVDPDPKTDHINKIRQLVGLTGKNSKFDKALETQLKAWQEKQKFKKTEITGKWDEATQEQFIKLLRDTDYEFRDTQITDLVTKTNLNPKPKEETEPEEELNTTEIPLRNNTEVKSFREWFLREHPKWNDGKNKTDRLDATGKSKTTSAFLAAWAIEGANYKTNIYQEEDGPVGTKTTDTFGGVDNTANL